MYYAHAEDFNQHVSWFAFYAFRDFNDMKVFMSKNASAKRVSAATCFNLISQTDNAFVENFDPKYGVGYLRCITKSEPNDY